jgi:hypothetical protein
MVTEVLAMLSPMVINNGDVNFRRMLIVGHGSADRTLIVTTSSEVMFMS